MRPPLLYRHRGGGGLVAETVDLDLQGVLLVPKMAFKWRSNGVLIVPELPFELRDVVVVLAGLLCEEILLRMVLVV